MGSTKWNNKKGVQCAVCSLWMDSNKKNPTPNHKPKGDILSAKDCPGSGRAPKRTKGFEFRPYPYKDRDR